jgi:hypothetical protein
LQSSGQLFNNLFLNIFIKFHHFDAAQSKQYCSILALAGHRLHSLGAKSAPMSEVIF